MKNNHLISSSKIVDITETDKKLNDEFVKKLTLIEQRYINFNKHIQIRIEKWVEKLILCDSNTFFRKKRNLFINLLLQMVQRQNIFSFFLKMPPYEIPNLSESQYHMLLQEVRKRKKVQSQQKHQQISIKKIQNCQGDTQTCRATPFCQTDRQQIDTLILNQIQNGIKNQNKQRKRSNISKKSKENQFSIQKQNKYQHILSQLSDMMIRNKQKFQQNQSFNEILKNIAPETQKSKIISSYFLKDRKKTSRNSINQQQSYELRVQEGVNRTNLDHLFSPRGTTQIQYIQAAFQP